MELHKLIWVAGLPAIWSPVITFVVFAVQASVRDSHPLNTVQIFTSLSIVTLVTSPAAKLLALLPQIAAAMGSFERIQDYLFLELRIDNRILLPDELPDTQDSLSEHGERRADFDSQNMSMWQLDMIRFNGATIYPAHNVETAAIIEATFTIPKASLTILVGPIGSGKTTLLKAILGELSCRSGSVSIKSTSISYCSQASFVLNDTVRKNVCGLSRLDIDENWYQAVMNACDMKKDVQRWSDGDDTVVGSKGLKLSGGQRQRLVCRMLRLV